MWPPTPKLPARGLLLGQQLSWKRSRDGSYNLHELLTVLARVTWIAGCRWSADLTSFIMVIFLSNRIMSKTPGHVTTCIRRRPRSTLCAKSRESLCSNLPTTNCKAVFTKTSLALGRKVSRMHKSHPPLSCG